MTGVLNAMAGIAPGLRYTVTVGNSGTTYGYNDSAGPLGSISPSATYKGVTIRVVSSNASPGQFFTVTLNGDLPQNFFTAIEVQRTDGSPQTFYTSSAASFTGGVTTIWSWNNTPAYVWSATGTRSIRIF